MTLRRRHARMLYQSRARPPAMKMIVDTSNSNGIMHLHLRPAKADRHSRRWSDLDAPIAQHPERRLSVVIIV